MTFLAVSSALSLVQPFFSSFEEQNGFIWEDYNSSSATGHIDQQLLEHECFERILYPLASR